MLVPLLVRQSRVLREGNTISSHSYLSPTPFNMLSNVNSPVLAILVFLSLHFHVILGADPLRARHQPSADSDVAAVERPSVTSTSYPSERLLFADDFDEFDLGVWQHELTMGGGGNWEFEYYSLPAAHHYHCCTHNALHSTPPHSAIHLTGCTKLTADLLPSVC